MEIKEEVPELMSEEEMEVNILFYLINKQVVSLFFLCRRKRLKLNHIFWKIYMRTLTILLMNV